MNSIVEYSTRGTLQTLQITGNNRNKLRFISEEQVTQTDLHTIW